MKKLMDVLSMTSQTGPLPNRFNFHLCCSFITQKYKLQCQYAVQMHHYCELDERTVTWQWPLAM